MEQHIHSMIADQSRGTPFLCSHRADPYILSHTQAFGSRLRTQHLRTQPRTEHHCSWRHSGIQRNLLHSWFRCIQCHIRSQCTLWPSCLQSSWHRTYRRCIEWHSCLPNIRIHSPPRCIPLHRARQYTCCRSRVLRRIGHSCPADSQLRIQHPRTQKHSRRRCSRRHSGIQRSLTHSRHRCTRRHILYLRIPTQRWLRSSWHRTSHRCTREHSCLPDIPTHNQCCCIPLRNWLRYTGVRIRIRCSAERRWQVGSWLHTQHPDSESHSQHQCTRWHNGSHCNLPRC
jgi:hypothetical protein